MNLKDNVAIVTGAGGGLGRAHAEYLARKGAKVVVNDLSPESIEATVEAIRAAGGEAIGSVASVTNEAAVERMVEDAVREWGRIDILVNNAGILRDRSFTKMSIDEFRLVVDVHLIGSAICTKAVWELMREQNYGRIVMTTSSSGLFGNFGQANYGAAKMALVGLMQTLAIEGSKYNIRVNCLAPTAATGMTQDILGTDQLAALAPELVSPALLLLAGADAPTRAIVCAGAGHFARSHITLTDGMFIGAGEDAGEELIRSWDAVSDRSGEIVPDYGFTQAEREVASASAGKQFAVLG
ncbi:SDR family NAD(P)-dependent oxidoreductase [Sphingomonas alba]|uniref:SDR family NAD(P)-dependent oxidoreductase n=1 Tax=Sphingomonas alba TaxID=2908208 RepID=A0ABT0RLL8_9SPHN|nr:SDR family NAD(P)-dependent oxidoreductase [Sphingomonas alba]